MSEDPGNLQPQGQESFPPPPPPYAQYPPPPPGYAYPAPGYYPVPVQRGWNGLAIAGFVLSIVWLYGLGSLLAIIFGHIARSQIRKDNQQGGGLALAGLIIGYVGLAGAIIAIIALSVAVKNNNPY